VEQGDWQQRLTRVIAHEIRRYRLELGLSAQKLSDRTDAGGFKIPRAVIANLENGHRESVSVAELTVLARALDVPPLLLLYPVGRQEDVEVLPGRHTSPWDALMWFSGMTTRPALPTGSSSAVQIYQAHEMLRANYWTQGSEGQALMLENLRQIRTMMRERDLIPPRLTGNLGAAIGEEDDIDAIGPRPVVAAIVTSALGVLVGRRNDGRPPWTFIAGEVEPGESPEDAAVREVKEETGLEVRAGAVIGERLHPATGRTMIYLAAVPARGTDVYVGDRAELGEVRWVDLAEADELLPGMFGPVRQHLAEVIPGGRR
jgi:8-oxo-dGTP pyrophosphatase MutT (NUDIX family)/transcriptional regulator with XRE-family HTH domain